MKCRANTFKIMSGFVMYYTKANEMLFNINSDPIIATSIQHSKYK